MRLPLISPFHQISIRFFTKGLSLPMLVEQHVLLQLDEILDELREVQSVVQSSSIVLRLKPPGNAVCTTEVIAPAKLLVLHHPWFEPREGKIWEAPWSSGGPMIHYWPGHLLTFWSVWPLRFLYQ
jgi:hypothetical protein